MRKEEGRGGEERGKEGLYGKENVRKGGGMRKKGNRDVGRGGEERKEGLGGKEEEEGKRRKEEVMETQVMY